MIRYQISQVKKKNPGSGATLTGAMKTPSKGISSMEYKHSANKSQLSISEVIHFPNRIQIDIPTSAKIIQSKFLVSPHYAKLIAEHQGYDMGGA